MMADEHLVRGCQFITADRRPGIPATYCGAETRPRSCYCLEHHVVCRTGTYERDPGFVGEQRKVEW